MIFFQSVNVSNTSYMWSTLTIQKREKEGPLLSAFDHFDPLKDQLPESFLVDFGPIVERAQEIIKGCKRKEINRTLKEISRILRKGSNNLARQIEKMKKTGKEFANVSYTAILRDEIEEKDSLSEAGQAVYFAVLSLALVGEAFNTPQCSPENL